MSRKQSSLSALAVLFSLTAAVPPVVSLTISPVAAQSKTDASFPVPKNLAKGTVLRVNGSSSMMKINEALTQKFKTKFAGTDVKVAYDGTNAALKAVLDGKSDLAAIGRPLTDAEKAKGLVAAPVTRNKIAMIVDKDNPLKASLTIGQFAQIFRGQITDWSKVGGKAGKIRMIDRPDSSDTRQAFQNYPVFKSAPFKAGGNAVRLKEDSTDAVIKALGKDGIGYAIADQVVNNPKVRVVAMHDVAPTDQRYPFSQPLSYVYKASKPSPAVKAFLGYAVANENQEVVEKARVETAKSPVAAAPQNASNAKKETVTAPAAKEVSGSQQSIATATGALVNPGESETKFPWWLLFIPALGGLLWWFMRKFSFPPASFAPDIAPAPYNGAVAPGVAPSVVPPLTDKTRIVFTPRDSQNGYAYWEIPSQVQEDLRREGRRGMKLRLHDVTDTNDIDMGLHLPHKFQEFHCKEREQDLHIPIPEDNHDYVAEIGYETSDDGWLRVARSERVHVPPSADITDKAVTSLWGEPVQVASSATTIQDNPEIKAKNAFSGLVGIAAAGAAAVGGASLFNFFGKNRKSETDNQIDKSQVILVPRTANSAYAYWDIPEARKTELQNQGGKKLAVRLYDATDVDLDTQPVEVIQQYECGTSNDLHIDIPASDRDYLAELGYIKDDGGWLEIAHSEPVRVSSSMPVSLDNCPSQSPVDVAKATVGSLATKTADVVGNTVEGTTNLVDNTTKKASNWMGEAVKSVGATLAGGAAAVASVGTVTHAFFDKKGLSRDGDGNADVTTSRDGDGNADVTISRDGDGNSDVTPLYDDNRNADVTILRDGIGNGNKTTAFWNGNADAITVKKQCQIILVPRNFQHAYAYWEVSDVFKQAARNQGGRRFVLRVHDATNLDIDQQQPHATQEYHCDERDYDRHVVIPISNRDYIAEVGYYTDDNRWIRIIRSFHVRVS